MAYTVIFIVIAVSVFGRILSNINDGKCVKIAMEAGIEDVSDGVHFGSSNTSHMELTEKEPLFSLSFNFSASIATYSGDGVIFYISNTTDDSMFRALVIENGRIVLKSSQTKVVSMIVTKDNYNDGKYHSVTVSLSKDGGELYVNGKVRGTLNATLGVIKGANTLYIGGLPEFLTLDASSNITSSAFCGCMANIKVNEQALSHIEERLPCSLSHPVNSMEEKTPDFKVNLSATERSLESLQNRTVTNPESSTQKATVEKTESTQKPTSQYPESTQKEIEYTTQQLQPSVAPRDGLHFTTEQQMTYSTRIFFDNKSSSLPTPPKLTITARSQKVYADDPLSNIPIYVCVAVVVITIACVSHLAYRKVKRLVDQKQEYNKIPMQELHQLDRKPKEKPDIKEKDKFLLSQETEDRHNDASQGRQVHEKGADGQTSKSKDGSNDSI